MEKFKLNNEPKIEPGFKIPDNYFENFSAKMLEQLPMKESTLISLFRKRKSRMIMIAAVLVIALMLTNIRPSSENVNEIDAITMENYLTSQSHIDSYDLVSDLDPEDIKKIRPISTLQDETIEDHLSKSSNLEDLLIE